MQPKIITITPRRQQADADRAAEIAKRLKDIERRLTALELAALGRQRLARKRRAARLVARIMHQHFAGTNAAKTKQRGTRRTT